MTKKKDKKTPKEAARLFEELIKTGVKDKPKPTPKKKLKK